jgi:hypothetical protein
MNHRFSLPLWEEYAWKISPELPQKIIEDSSSYNFNRDILPVLLRSINDREKLDEANCSLEAATEMLNIRFAEIFGMEIQVDIILYLGLCNGAGWATTLDAGKRFCSASKKSWSLNGVMKEKCVLSYTMSLGISGRIRLETCL